MNSFTHINLLQYCAAAAFVLNREHKVAYWNEACERLTGITSGEIIGTRDHWRGFYDHPRPCLSDLIIDRDLDRLNIYYDVYGTSKLLASGWHAEGWYPNLGGERRYIFFDAAPIYDKDKTLLGAIETLKDITNRKIIEEENQTLAHKLQISLNKIKVLKGLLPICAKCKKIRDSRGYWHPIEEYISAHSNAEFSHAICPECARSLYPDFIEKEEETDALNGMPPL